MVGVVINGLVVIFEGFYIFFKVSFFGCMEIEVDGLLSILFLMFFFDLFLIYKYYLSRFVCY